MTCKLSVDLLCFGDYFIALRGFSSMLSSTAFAHHPLNSLRIAKAQASFMEGQTV